MRDAKGVRPTPCYPRILPPPTCGDAASFPDLASRVAALPEGIDQLTRERWVAIMHDNPEAAWPGDCARASCRRPMAALDTGLCMPHDLAGPKRRTARLAS
jgi:hypothetical protein